MTAVELEAPAKVNLALHVHEREPSGFHRIETLFQALELADQIRVEQADGDRVEIEVTGGEAGPAQDNLALRAAHAYLHEAGVRCGLRIRLEKSIPAGAGLGGGSSDAAATLRALNGLLGALSSERLFEVACLLGSDVPFFLCGSPLALGRGRGEDLVALASLPAAPVILAFPGVSVSTAKAYTALDGQRAARYGSEPTAGSGGASRATPLPTGVSSWQAVRPLAQNDFEELIYTLHPEIARIRDALEATGPCLVLLSGSGSAVFAVYDDLPRTTVALERLQRGGEGTFFLTRTSTAVPEPRFVK